jgi:acyl-CoA synthetase (AMP-forming)/AMP-acid ligase II
MHTSMLLDMAADGFGERAAVTTGSVTCSYATLADLSRRAAGWLAERGAERVALVDVNSAAVPVLLFGAGVAGIPFAPVNYRLADGQLRAILARCAPCVVVVADEAAPRVAGIEGVTVVPRAAFLAELAATEPKAGVGSEEEHPEDIAILLFTSGTTGQPKAAVLRHRHLTSYIIAAVEFMAANEAEAALVSVPPYHIAGISAVLSSAFAGRRIVYLPAFSPEDWVAAARDEAVTHAMVVPTMLGRILDVLERDEIALPALRHLSYGGGRMPVPVIERALTLLPQVGFVNAYGLTETSSTIAMLGPDDHRTALASKDPAVRAILGSVGRPLPGVEVEIRDADGEPVAPGQSGVLWVRGEQVSGEYADRAGPPAGGWFCTRDTGYLDPEGFLYLQGRVDDVIVRGGENISPGEIEDALTAHPAVADAGAVGVPDHEWGEKVVAVVVLADGASATEGELKDWVRAQLRSSRTPSLIAFGPALPYNETGKLLRRVLKEELIAQAGT